MVKTSGLAITSFVMGILGLFIPVIFSLVAIVLGIIAIKQIKKDPNLKGRGLAIAGLVIGIIGLVRMLVVFILGFGMGGGGVLAPQFGIIETHTPQV